MRFAIEWPHITGWWQLSSDYELKGKSKNINIEGSSIVDEVMEWAITVVQNKANGGTLHLKWGALHYNW